VLCDGVGALAVRLYDRYLAAVFFCFNTNFFLFPVCSARDFFLVGSCDLVSVFGCWFVGFSLVRWTTLTRLVVLRAWVFVAGSCACTMSVQCMIIHDSPIGTLCGCSAWHLDLFIAVALGRLALCMAVAVVR
jgi:hypothetical protein